MAYTEIHPIKSTLDLALAYICNPVKTDGKLLISSFGCSHETADIEFGFTLAQTKIHKGDNLAHHLIQSFDPGETTPEQAHEIGEKLAQEVTGGQYEYVLSTHIDKGHIHNHILFCAANFISRNRYISNRKSLYQIRNANDKLCREYNLSTILPDKRQGLGRIEYTNNTGQRVTRPAKNRAKSRGEYQSEKTGTSWKALLREAIDKYIELSSDFEDMLRRMEQDGFSIKRAKYHSYKLPDGGGKDRFTGGPSLGPEYTDERIRERIAGRVSTPRRKIQPRSAEERINLLIDIANNIKAQQNVGYSNALKVINLKEAANTLNYLTENNLLHYEDIQAKITDTVNANQLALGSLKQMEKRIGELGLMIKHIETYQRTKPFADGLKTAKDKKQYRSNHESALILYESAQKVLKALQPQGGKLPSPSALRAEYKQLINDKDALYAEYRKLQRQVKQLDTLKTNVDSILGTTSQSKENVKEKPKDVDL